MSNSIWTRANARAWSNMCRHLKHEPNDHEAKLYMHCMATINSSRDYKFATDEELDAAITHIWNLRREELHLFYGEQWCIKNKVADTNDDINSVRNMDKQRDAY